MPSCNLPDRKDHKVMTNNLNILMKKKYLTRSPKLFLSSLFMFCYFQALWAQQLLPPHGNPRIVGGQSASGEAWPWLATLITRDPLNSEAISLLEGQFCAGTLIHPRWILTAAHCVFDSSWTGAMPSDQIDIVFGIDNLRTDQGERIHVRNIVIHPQYSSQSQDSPDIALLELEKSVNRSTLDFVTDPNLSLEGILATVIGWGDSSSILERPLYLDELQQVSIPIVSREICQASLQQENASEVSSPPTMDHIICAGEEGKDSCYGDSGGPLVIADGEEWKQVGIVSGGTSKRCAHPNSYGIYTRIAEFSEFIESTICQENFPETLFTHSLPSAPQLTLKIEGNLVTASWNEIPRVTGYQIFYAPYPEGIPVGSLKVGQVTSYSVRLPSGQSYYVALRAYHGICHGDFSNIDFFTSLP